MSLEIVGPFSEYAVILNGWRVPLIDARENDGGTVTIIVDGRLAHTVPGGEAENVLRLVADVIAAAWGYGAHPTPERERDFENRADAFRAVPHPLLAPHRVFGIASASTERAALPDDPRSGEHG